MNAATKSKPDAGAWLLSVVVPVFNEAGNIELLYRRLVDSIAILGCDYELVFVDDGSNDATAVEVETLRERDPRIALVELSRNFGKEIAMTAGLDLVSGDATVVIDADLQDPPELIPQLVKCWREGYDVVYAVRTARRGDTLLKRITAHLFYRLMRRTGSVRIPADTGDFRLLSRRAVHALVRLREQHRFMKGLFTWIGYRQIGVHYEREPRRNGESKWDYWRLWNFALEGITSFTTAPLRMATYFGLVTAGFAFLYGSWIIFKTLLYGDPVAGYPSMMAVILFLGGVQLAAIGVIGEYLGRMFDESKRRPLYLVQRHLPSSVKQDRGREHGSDTA